MLKFILSVLLLIIATVYGSGEFIVVHSPPSIRFEGNDPVKASLLPEIYSTCLGLTTMKSSNWRGLFIVDPFELPTALVTVAIDGVKEFDYSSNGHYFPLKTDLDESDIYSTLEKRYNQHYPQKQINKIRLDLIDSVDNIKLGKPSKTVYLKATVDEDRAFLDELNRFNAIIDQFKTKSSQDGDDQAIVWFKFSSLHAIHDLYGENSTQIKEAKQLLNEAIKRLTVTFREIYNDQVIINIVTSDNSHTRRTRNILQSDSDQSDDLNLAAEYNEDYPAIFNIILWFGVAMFFSLLAICIAIATMDPGRDSIIYRMTSTRMKKDN